MSNKHATVMFKKWKYGCTLLDQRSEFVLQNVCDQFFGSNILVVSHGEAVRASVNRLSPDSTVYETKHTSYTVANRNITIESIHPSVFPAASDCDVGDGFGNMGRQSVSFTTSRWTLLTKNGTTGVSWVD